MNKRSQRQRHEIRIEIVHDLVIDLVEDHEPLPGLPEPVAISAVPEQVDLTTTRWAVWLMSAVSLVLVLAVAVVPDVQVRLVAVAIWTGVAAFAGLLIRRR